MKDQLGLYYYPAPQHTEARMYVRRFGGRIEFRMWHQGDPSVWDKHNWLSLDVIQQAAQMFKAMGKESDPTALYDVSVAERLLADE
ncbi:MAG: hypothetical protein KKA55_03025 [Proteobacteria bacterium]|nr:hypothetical protein [Pseudomonadota bacterium]MBU1594490.1 hypothetical protein [Pseudomonadota bacterium]